MKHSPLQLRHLLFKKISVDAVVDDSESGESDAENSDETGFDFNGVTFDSSIDVKCQDDETADPRAYTVNYAFRITNETGKKCPYLIEFIASGLFEVVGKVPLAERETFVVVNGTTLLFGVMREQIASITARGLNGMLFLPTVNFLDLKKPKADVAVEAQSPTT